MPTNSSVIDVDEFVDEVQFTGRSHIHWDVDGCDPPIQVLSPGNSRSRARNAVISAAAAKKRAAAAQIAGQPKSKKPRTAPPSPSLANVYSQPSRRPEVASLRKRSRQSSNQSSEQEVIVLVSGDEEDEQVPPKRARLTSTTPHPDRRQPVAGPSTVRPPLEQHQQGPEEDDYDSEADYENIHGGLRVHDSLDWETPSKWQTRLRDVDQAQRPEEPEALVEDINALSLGSNKRDTRIGRWRTHCSAPPKERPLDLNNLWDQIKHLSGLLPPCPPNLLRQLNYHTLKPVTSFKPAVGGVNRVVQNHQQMVAICRTTSHGNLYDADFTIEGGPDDYNNIGAIQVFYKGQDHCLPGHSMPLEQGQKYYSVQDIKFDPHRQDRLLSTGSDEKLQVWDLRRLRDPNRALDDESYLTDNPDEEDQSVAVPDQPGGPAIHRFVTAREPHIYWQSARIASLTFPGAPHDLHYQPDGTALAVTCFDGSIYIYPSSDKLLVPNPRRNTLLVGRPGNESVGAMRWGTGLTSRMIFASSEPIDVEHHVGSHKAFDVEHGRVDVFSRVKEGGDGMALDPEGNTLALFTEASEAEHVLRLYDVRTKNYRQPLATVELEHFRKAPAQAAEVNCASFCPADGRYLAVGRSDNRTHVYDVRMIEDPVWKLRHQQSDRQGGYGVLAMAWTQTRDGRGLGLLTGGEDHDDGCVRLWDMRLSDRDYYNGNPPVVKMPSGVADFSVGDPYDGQFPLVVGDCAGTAHIYEGMGLNYEY